MTLIDGHQFSMNGDQRITRSLCVLRAPCAFYAVLARFTRSVRVLRGPCAFYALRARFTRSLRVLRAPCVFYLLVNSTDDLIL